MKTLIIVNQISLAKSLQRYNKFLYDSDSSYITFTELLSKGTSPYTKFELIISDIYNDNFIDYGLQFGELFESSGSKIIFFFTQNSYTNNYSIQDLPQNAFHLPMQLKEFLHSFDRVPRIENSSSLLMTILNSNPITTSHH